MRQLGNRIIKSAVVLTPSEIDALTTTEEEGGTLNDKSNELLNIEVGTFKRARNKLILELNHNQFRYDQLSELNELKEADANFLQLVNVVEQGQKVVLTYTLPDKVRSLKNLPHENKAIRSAIAKEIMAQKVVNDSQYHIALNPS
ncbi:membrane TMS [Lactiplantibacillus plantarum]|nr:membrane TMS [Lactiplantibacillus plantarum]